MATRLTTNQEIAGSTPAVVMVVFGKLLIHVAVLLLMVMMIVFALYQAALSVSTQL